VLQRLIINNIIYINVITYEECVAVDTRALQKQTNWNDTYTEYRLFCTLATMTRMHFLTGVFTKLSTLNMGQG